jgi:hypothetical protein
MSKTVVSSYNEWDPLEEVIVGTLDGACVMPWETAYEAVIPREEMAEAKRFHSECGGLPIPGGALASAQTELQDFVHILEGEGVIVRRPEPIDFGKEYAAHRAAGRGARPAGGDRPGPRPAPVAEASGNAMRLICDEWLCHRLARRHPREPAESSRRLTSLVLPPRRSERSYPRAVKIKMGNYPRKRRSPSVA